MIVGGATGPAGAGAWSGTAPGQPPGARFGCAVRPLGDANGDGYADVIVTAEAYPPSNTGAAFIYLSNPNSYPGSLPPTPTQTILGPGQGANFGTATSSLVAGDVNGDGFADVVIGAYGANSNTGTASLYLGTGAASLPFATSPSALLNGAQLGEQFGFGAGTAGDVNGDGLSDVLVVAQSASNPELSEGRLMLYYGQPGVTALQAPLAGQTPSLSGTSGSAFATALTTAGDVNGDGFSDLLVGAPGFQGTSANEGRVLLYKSKSDGTGLENQAIWTFSGGQVDARLGTSVAYAGDVNDDGYTDVLVGAPGFATSPAQFQEGKAFLFFGTASGVLASTPAWEFESNEINAKFGQSVAGAGDVNGDGYADVCVGAPGATVSGLQDSGRVYVFLGSATGLSLTAAAVIDNPVLGDARFGASVANAGDLNRDGQTDLVVGAPDYSSGQSEEGRIYVFLGSAAGIVPTPAFTDESNSPGAHFGAAVSTAGDVDSDGFADLLIGAPDLPGGGRASLYRGRSGVAPIVPTPQHLPGLQGGARMGAAVCFAGDVNNDGFSDVAIGAPNHNGNQGEVYVHVGVSSGLAPSPAITFPGASGANLGAGLGPCGDIDGDGFSDVVRGQPGQQSGSGGAVIYVGGSQYNVTRAPQQRRLNNLSAIDALGLSDDTQQVRLQSGSNTIANVRSTPAGRTRVALEWELKSGAALLDGSNLARGAFQDIGAPTAPVTLNESISGLSPAQRHQWRHRIATTNPLFPHGRWNSIQGNGKHEKKFGTGFDCNNNGVPDSTEVAQNPALDCDGNGGIDACQIALDPTLDCDNDGILNSCELFANDCDANNYPDDCQLAQGAPDCNANVVLDACELSPATDANGDSILDVCQFTSYCFGDGTGTACPCGNSGGAGRGCANSVNANGAVLTVSGWPSIANDTLVLHAAGMPNSVSPSSQYLQATLQDNGGFGTPIQDGLRCVGGAIVRLGARPNSGNQSQYPDVGNQPVSIRGGLVSLGMPQTRHYQVFYRNAAATFCPPGTANWTNGLSIVWGP
ncbi:MAG: VCBS repeat-containing protein [Planctomycetes bacterium]|nr:VCBS repeat-containing protein [Planctomycetota bacterium]